MHWSYCPDPSFWNHVVGISRTRDIMVVPSWLVFWNEIIAVPPYRCYKSGF
jgi:hypothetical protein